MKYTRTALGLLTRQYRSVLKKCFLINLGLFMLSAPAKAATTVTTYDALLSALAGSSTADVVLDRSGNGMTITGDGFEISENQKVALKNIGTAGSSSWNNGSGTDYEHRTPSNFFIKNDRGTLSLNNIIIDDAYIRFSEVGNDALIRNYYSGHITQIKDVSFTNIYITGASSMGGIITNSTYYSSEHPVDYTATIDLIQNVTVKDVLYAPDNAGAPHGGFIENHNKGHIGTIDNLHIENFTMRTDPSITGGNHGIIDNQAYSTIDKIINSEFINSYLYRPGQDTVSKTKNNHASAAGLYNQGNIGLIENVRFEDNHVMTEFKRADDEGKYSGSGGGAAIMSFLGGIGGEVTVDNYVGIGKIKNVQFINNRVENYEPALAGAVTMGGGKVIDDKWVIGHTSEFTDTVFDGNYTYSTGSSASAGAISNTGIIDVFTGEFKNNYAKADGTFAQGGAIHMSSSIDETAGYRGTRIGSLTADFTGNYTQAITESSGGAIFNSAQIGTLSGNFSTNHSVSSDSASYGGVLYNQTYSEYQGNPAIGYIESINGDFTQNYTSGALNSLGGAIMNRGKIDAITGDFIGNHANSSAFQARGGAISNDVNNLLSTTKIAEIGSITAKDKGFKDNYVYSIGHSVLGGALINRVGKITSVNADFTGNYAKTDAATYKASGGAIYNGRSTIDDITGDFSSNYTLAVSHASGGAINNNDTGEIGTITGDFANNYAKSTGTSLSESDATYARGGAITNTGHIEKVDGNFSSNKAESAGIEAQGGAIYQIYGEGTSSGTIDEISGDYENNYALATNFSGTAQGGAIYNGDDSTISIVDSEFLSNYAEGTNFSPTVQGGAIYNLGNISNITNTIFNGNYVKSAQSTQNKTSGGAINTLKGDATTTYTGIANITNSSFENNYAQNYSGAYGGAISAGEGIIDNITNTGFTENYATSTTSFAYGGALKNSGIINSLDGGFIGNYVSAKTYARGGAIYNERNEGDSVSIMFTNDDTADIKAITATFKDNYAAATNKSAFGGAIYNTAMIGEVNGDFLRNYARSTNSYAAGGAVYIGHISLTQGDTTTLYNSKITSFDGDFTGNYARGTNAIGGAIYNNGTQAINSITGNFSGNEARADSEYAYGGAIYNIGDSSKGLTATISNITGSFEQNKTIAPKGAFGGAIYNGANGNITVKDSSFTSNLANTSDTIDYVGGGAIYNAGNLTFSGTNTFTKNEIKYISSSGGSTPESVTSYNDIHNAGTVTISANGILNINDGITGNGGTISMGSGSKINLNSTLSGNTVNMNNSSIFYGSYMPDSETLLHGILNTVALNTSANGGTLNASDNHFQDSRLGQVKFLSDLHYVADVNVGAEIIDTLTTTSINSSSTGKVLIDSFNVLGSTTFADVTEEDFKIKVLNTQSNKLQLALSSTAENQLGGERLLSSEYTGTTTDVIKAATDWGEKYYTHDSYTDTYGELGLATTTTTNDSIGMHVTRTDTRETSTSLGDTLYLVNKDTTNTDKTFTATTANPNYTLGTNLSATKGNLTVTGLGAATSTLDLNGKTGFSIGTGNSLTLQNLTLTSSGSNSSLSNGATLGLNGATINNSIAFTNAGTLNLSGTNNINTAISGSGGVTNVNGGTTNLNATLTQSNLTVANGATLKTNANNLATSNAISNNGTLQFTGGTLSKAVNGSGSTTAQSSTTTINAKLTQTDLTVNSGATLTTNAGNLAITNAITNNGALQFTGGTLSQAVNGTGSTTAQSGNTTLSAVLTQNDLTVNSGATLTTNANNLAITNAITNNGALQFTGGTLSQAVNGTGSTTAQSGTTILGAKLTQKDLTINSGATLNTNAGNLAITNAISNNGTLQFTGGTLSQAVNGSGDTTAQSGTTTLNAALNQKSLTVNSGATLNTNAGNLAITNSITNNGALQLTGGTLAKAVNGNGSTTALSGNTTLNAKLTQTDLTVNSGATLTTNAGNLAITNAISNNGTLQFIGGTLSQAVNGSGSTTALSGNTTLDAVLTQNNLTINSGAALNTNADNLDIANAITNNGALQFTGGALSQAVNGNGSTTALSGNTTLGAKLTQSNLTINSGATLTTDAGNLAITNAISNNGTLQFIGGTLSQAVNGTGNTIAQSGTTTLNSALTQKNLIIDNGAAITTNANNLAITNAITDNGTLHLSGGTLAQSVNGTGIVNLIDDVTLAANKNITVSALNLGTSGLTVNNTANNAINVSNFTNSGASGLNLANNTIQNVSLGAVNLAGNLNYTLDINAGSKIADTLTATSVNNSSAGKVMIDSFNILGTTSFADITDEDYKIKILNTPSGKMQLALSAEAEAQLGGERELYHEETGTTQDPIQADTDWGHVYESHTTVNYTYGTLGLATTSTLNDSIGMTNIRHVDVTTDSSLGDTLYLVNKDTTNTDKTFTATTANPDYTLGTNLSATKGNLTVTGLGAATSTLDLNGKTGFSIGTGNSLTLQNLTLTSSGSNSSLNNGATLGLNGTTVNNSIAFTNTGAMNLSGTNNINTAVSGSNGTTNVNSGTTNLNAKLTQKDLTVNEGATLTANASNLAITNAITNNGALQLTGGTLAKAVNGTGGITAQSGTTTANAKLTQKDLTINEGATLNASADNLAITNAITNNGALQLTGGTLTPAVNGTGGITAQSGTTNVSAKLTQNDLTINEGATLKANAGNLAIANAITNNGALQLTGGTLTPAVNGTGGITAQSGTTTANAKLTQKDLTINEDATLTANASNLAITNAITNNGALQLTGGTLTPAVNGTGGITAQSGTTTANAKLTQKDLTINEGATLNTNAGNLAITNAITNNGALQLTGGTLTPAVNGTGGITAQSGTTTLNAKLTQKDLTINEGATLTANAGNLAITNAITNNGALQLTGGTLTPAVNGTGGITAQSGTTNVSAKLTQNDLTINEGATLKANAGNLAIANAITNNGALQLTGGTLTPAVNGTGGITAQSGTTTANAKLTQKDLTINEGATLTANAGNLAITNAITNNGALQLTGGTLTPAVNGTGGITAQSGTTTANAKLTQKDLTINEGATLTANASNLAITNAITDNGTLRLSGGTLAQSVNGSGAVNLTADVTLAANKNIAVNALHLGTSELTVNNTSDNAINVSAFANSGESGLNLANDTIQNVSLGTVNLAGNLNYTLDINAESKTADILTASAVDNASTGKVMIDSFNVLGSTSFADITDEDYKIRILNTPSDKMQLALSETAIAQLGGERDIKQEVTDITPDDINADTSWDHEYKLHTTVTHTYGEIGLATSVTTNDSIGMNETRTQDFIIDSPLGDTLRLVAADLNNPSKTFTATEGGPNYTVAEGSIGINTRGALDISGLGKDESTLDLGESTFLLYTDAQLSLTDLTAKTSRDALIDGNGSVDATGSNLTGDINIDNVHKQVHVNLTDTTLNGDINFINQDYEEPLPETNDTLNLKDSVVNGDISLTYSQQINLDGANINGDINGYSGEQTVNLTGKTNLNGVIKPANAEATINAVSNNAELSMVGDTFAEAELYATNTTFNLDNEVIENYSFKQLSDDSETTPTDLYNIDFDVLEQQADTITVSAESAATIILNNLNMINGSFDDLPHDMTGKEFMVQILHAQNDNTQLALNDNSRRQLPSGDYEVGRHVYNRDDVLKANVSWNDVFYHKTQDEVFYGNIGLATTNTKNDTIGLTLTGSYMDDIVTHEPLGDTLAMLNTSTEFTDKTFTTDNPLQTYKVSDDLGQTSGNLLISGVAATGIKPAIDLDGHNGFDIGNNADVTVRDARIINSGDDATVVIQKGGKLTLDDAALSDVSMRIDGHLDITNSLVDVHDAYFGSDATLSLEINTLNDHGIFAADSVRFADKANLDVTLADNLVKVGEKADVHLLRTDDGNFAAFNETYDNNMYTFTRKNIDGWYTIRIKKTARELVAENNGSLTEQDAAGAWIDSPKENDSEYAKLLRISAQRDVNELTDNLSALAPSETPIVLSVEADNDGLFPMIAAHLRDDRKVVAPVGYNYGNQQYQNRPVYYQQNYGAPQYYQQQYYQPQYSGQGYTYGLSSGDLVNPASLWLNAYMGKAKYDDGERQSFDTDKSGFVVALEKQFIPSFQAGIGYSYEDNKIDAFKRDVDVESHRVFGFAEYKPGRFFVNAAASYGMSSYKEDKKVYGNSLNASYDTTTIAAQTLVGYQSRFFIPELGARVYFIERDSYTDDAGQRVASENMAVLRGVAGIRGGYDVCNGNRRILRPEFYVGITYDVISDSDKALVTLPNGETYSLYGKGLGKFGVETGLGLTADLTSRLSLSAKYSGDYRDKYDSHTGMLGVRYKF